jgi:hypothetical protein
MGHPIPSFELDPLEPRLLMTASPGDVLTGPLRQTLLDNISLSVRLRRSLQHKLDTSNPAGFDQQLLDYTRGRAGRHFFFRPDEVPDYVAYINANVGTDEVFYRADAILSNLYPEQNGVELFTVRLPSDVDWNYQGYSSNPETIHAVNRHFHWIDLAMAYRLSGNALYADKLIAQLADWSSENPPLEDPNSWRTHRPSWWLLDSSIRAGTWAFTYNLMLQTPKWTKEANTLAMVKLLQHGEFLHAATPQRIASNQALVHGQGLMYLAHLFPEFIRASTWSRYGRDLLFRSMDAQFYEDGSHVEQSPNYASVVLDRLLDARQLDDAVGFAWPVGRAAELTRAVEAYYQFLSPDGMHPAIGDTYRSQLPMLFLKANIVQGETRWPAARPSVRDAWVLGPDATEPYLGRPLAPPLGERGPVHAMTKSGNYIMRSGSDADARQIIFDVGPKGGGHGHYDLLNFELFGYGRPLIADPGLYKYDGSAQRKWVVSTPAHNTLSVDGVSHGSLEGSSNPGFAVTQWTVADDYVQVTAHHYAYGGLLGRPVVARSLWYDRDGTILLVDWGARRTDPRLP